MRAGEWEGDVNESDKNRPGNTREGPPAEVLATTRESRCFLGITPKGACGPSCGGAGACCVLRPFAYARESRVYVLVYAFSADMCVSCREL